MVGVEVMAEGIRAGGKAFQIVREELRCDWQQQGVYKFNRTNFQEISRRFQEGFQEKCRTYLHCFGLLCI